MKKTMRVLTALLASVLLLVGLLASAYAEEADKICNLHVLLKTTDDAPRPGADICAYLVATPDETAPLFYTVTPEFSGSGFTITPEISDDAAALLDAYAAENGLQGRTETTDDNGVAVFSDMAHGLYLIAQTGEPDDYSRMTPFVVLLPSIEGSRRIYEVEASPKPVTELPPASLTLTAEKQIRVGANGKIPKESLFSFVLTPENISNPMPKNGSGSRNPETGALTVSRKGAGDVVFGEIGFKSEDAGKTFVYTVRELKGTEQYFTYDTTVYTVSVRIERAEDGTLSASAVFAKGDQKVDKLLFTNDYDVPEGPPPEIPKTGQLWWPVGLLAGAGALLLIGGLMLRRREEATA